MIRRLLTVSLVSLFVAVPAYAAGLPDTGQERCFNDTQSDLVYPVSPDSVARDAGTHPRQDCRFGRDPAATLGKSVKVGKGEKGFDYTKIANNGTTLAAGAALGTAATDWACTRDNITGLTWEVKVYFFWVFQSARRLDVHLVQPPVTHQWRQCGQYGCLHQTI